jgi:hypothetical protein
MNFYPYIPLPWLLDIRCSYWSRAYELTCISEYNYRQGDHRDIIVTFCAGGEL